MSELLAGFLSQTVPPAVGGGTGSLLGFVNARDQRRIQERALEQQYNATLQELGIRRDEVDSINAQRAQVTRGLGIENDANEQGMWQRFASQLNEEFEARAIAANMRPDQYADTPEGVDFLAKAQLGDPFFRQGLARSGINLDPDTMELVPISDMPGSFVLRGVNPQTGQPGIFSIGGGNFADGGENAVPLRGSDLYQIMAGAAAKAGGVSFTQIGNLANIPTTPGEIVPAARSEGMARIGQLHAAAAGNIPGAVVDVATGREGFTPESNQSRLNISERSAATDDQIRYNAAVTDQDIRRAERGFELGQMGADAEIGRILARGHNENAVLSERLDVQDPNRDVRVSQEREALGDVEEESMFTEAAAQMLSAVDLANPRSAFDQQFFETWRISNDQGTNMQYALQDIQATLERPQNIKLIAEEMGWDSDPAKWTRSQREQAVQIVMHSRSQDKTGFFKRDVETRGKVTREGIRRFKDGGKGADYFNSRGFFK